MYQYPCGVLDDEIETWKCEIACYMTGCKNCKNFNGTEHYIQNMKRVFLCGQNMKLTRRNYMKELEVRRGNEILCTYVGEEQFPDASTMKLIKESGCKFYMDGKIYKPEKKVKKNESED